MEDMEKKYERLTGKDIRQSRNPRGAGRKKKYTEEADACVMELYAEGLSLRRTAEKAGSSTGHVQDVIKRRKTAEVYGN